MFRKICISAIAVFIAMQLLSACCGCDEYPTLPADWTGAKFWYGYYTVDSGTINSGADTSLDYSDRGLVLHWTPSVQVLAARFDRLHAFCNAAYACKCDDMRSYNMRRNVTAVSVRTLFPFDAQHPSGSEVTALFKHLNPTATALVAGPPELPQNLFQEYWTSSLYLDARPGRSGPQQFELELSLSDGASLRDTTDVLRF